MTQYIDKNAVEAKIDNLANQDFSIIDDLSGRTAYLQAIDDFYKALNSLGVKEVDLKQSYREYINNTYNEEFAKSVLDGNIKGDLDNSDLFGIMSYGFELGLKAQKGE